MRKGSKIYKMAIKKIKRLTLESPPRRFEILIIYDFYEKKKKRIFNIRYIIWILICIVWSSYKRSLSRSSGSSRNISRSIRNLGSSIRRVTLGNLGLRVHRISLSQIRLSLRDIANRLGRLLLSVINSDWFLLYLNWLRLRGLIIRINFDLSNYIYI